MFQQQVSVYIADPTRTELDDGSVLSFTLRYHLADTFDDKCPACVMYLEQTHKIVEFLNGAVLVPKGYPGKFGWVDKKRAIYLSDTSTESLLQWLTETFKMTFEYAHVERFEIIN